MAKLLTKVFLLTWKNMKLLQRHYIKTAFEIAIPILLFLLVAFMQSQFGNKEHAIVFENATYYEEVDGFKLKFPQETTSLYYTPSNNFTDSLMENVRKRLDINRVTSVASELELEKLFQDTIVVDMVSIGVVFINTEKVVPKKLIYRIRPSNDGSDRWNTGVPFPSRLLSGPMWTSGSFTYFESGFLALQQAIDWSFIDMVKPNNAPSVNYSVQEFPYPPYTTQKANFFDAKVLMSFFMFGYTLLCINIVGAIVEDRNSGVTELLKLMGLTRTMLWLTWFIRIIIVKLLIITVITIFLLVPFDADSEALYAQSNCILVWVFLVIASVAIIAFWFMTSTLFSRPWLAVMMAPIIWILTYNIAEALISDYSPLSFPSKLFSALLPSVTLFWGLRIIENYESWHAGLQWSNIFKSPGGSSDDLTMANVFFMMFFNILFYGFITWYIDAVKPGKFGIPQPFNFFCMKSYWQTSKVEAERTTYGSADSLMETYESPPHGLKVGIRIADLHKEFQSKTAVDGVTLDIYQDQITALLGHNGAGKTTTMSIMTGMLPATSGSIWINNYNIRTDMAKVRESLGLCPQHDMLFNDLTVKEHLIFFGMLKGLKHSEAQFSAVDLMGKMHILDKAHSMASTLSGGMKRKLSLAIALVGGSKVVILDEPTSGLDPEARRHIWDLLLSMRGERTILITTHFMEEADVLGDRIAIMDHGRVQCYGTSLFLKNKYGAGYVLKLLTKPNPDVTQISQLVGSHVPNSRLKSRLGSELAYSLPQECKPQFPELFGVLDSTKQSLGITSIGVSITTMEDVFLQVGHEASDGRGDEPQLTTSDSDASLHDSTIPKTTGIELLAQQMEALLIKKFLYKRRKWITFLVTSVMPILLMIGALILSSLSLDDKPIPPDPPLSLSLDQFEPSTVLFTSTDQSVTQWYDRLVKEVGCEPRPVSASVGLSDALLQLGILELRQYNSLIVAAEFNASARKLDVNAMYSGFGYHSAPISVNLVNNAVLKSYVGSNYSVGVTNYPLKRNQDFDINWGKGAATVWWTLFIPIGLVILVGNFLSFPLEERVSGARHLQRMTGVRPISYWLACFVADFLLYLIVAFLMVIVLLCLDTNRFFGCGKEAGVFALLLFMYGFSGIPYAYLFSFFKKTSASGLSTFISLNLVTGTILPSVMIILESLAVASHWESTVGFFKKLFYLFPPFNIFFGLMDFASLAISNNECSSMTEAKKEQKCAVYPTNPCCHGDVKVKSYLEFASDENPQGLGLPLTMLAIGCPLFFALILLTNHGIMSLLREMVKRLICRNRLSQNQGEDEIDADVRVEVDRVQEGGENALTVNDLMKVYGLNPPSVKGVTFGVKSGECFGLLGFNGAGKTTTFKMLTGVERPTKGDARIDGFFLDKNKAAFMSQIGYCPQFDAINEFLTGREMLQLFARLRGVNKQEIAATVDKWLKLMGLEEYKNLKCGKYSGGNKRKLSTAMALIGDPPLIFLDEPTTGVDPVARRNLWSVLARVQQTDRAIVLTTHSMEECEALCSRLAIMVKGQFVCIGENQYLKQKFGQGFTVTIKLADMPDEEEQANIVKNEFEKLFKRGNCNLKDQRHGLLHYHLTDPNIPWKDLFSNMESLKSRLEAVEDYTVSETTLEQVFLSFAKD